jgi:hypothetical protein
MVLAANRGDLGADKDGRHVRLLAGFIYDADGEPMAPSHAVKKGVRYRYYVAKSLLIGGVKAEGRGSAVPANKGLVALGVDELEAVDAVIGQRGIAHRRRLLGGQEGLGDRMRFEKLVEHSRLGRIWAACRERDQEVAELICGGRGKAVIRMHHQVRIRSVWQMEFHRHAARACEPAETVDSRTKRVSRYRA